MPLINRMPPPLGSQPVDPCWTEEIHRVILLLEQLNGETERDFLAVGGSLMSFLSSSRLLHEEISGLNSMVTGMESQNACDALDSVRRYAEQLRRRSELSTSALVSLRSGAGRIRQGFSTFGNIATSFRVTAILARMEAARLSTTQQNLKSLADDVGECSSGIQGRAEQVLDAAGEFDARIASTLPAIARFDAIQRHELPALLTSVDADVAAFGSRIREAAETSASLARAQQALNQELSSITCSIQFHDITRQQIEHVIDALKKLLSDHSAGQIRAAAAALIFLQKSQLDHAAAAFDDSSGKIVRDLDAVAARVADMAADESVAGSGRSQQDSFWKEMRQRFDTLSNSVSELDSLECGTREVVADLRNTSETLRKAVEEVQAIEFQLGHISINAVISARHIGAEGDALKAIADSIRQVRTESASHTGDARLALESIREAIATLPMGAAPDRGAFSASVLRTQLSQSANNLEATQNAAAGEATKIVNLASALCAGIRKVRDGFTIGRRFAETMNRCRGSLEEVARKCGHELSGLPAQGPPETEAAVEERYTMRSERDIYHASLGLATAAGPAGAPQHEEEVEFF
jgi:hypothetical protein